MSEHSRDTSEPTRKSRRESERGAARDSPVTDDRYSLVQLENGAVLLYDRNDYDAWIKSEVTVNLHSVA